jgi:UDP-N-acetylglucosamine:LPS N-acetylglucosamine transferase
MVTSMRSTTENSSPVPRRALIVSADIGAGHNSAGRALEEAMGRAWPGCQVRWLDTLAAAGPGFGPLARAFYVSQVRHTPRMYEFFFSAMGRHRWYLESVRRGSGAWFGRRMEPRIRALDPDVIVSTYPLGSAGLSWLRRHGKLAVPAGAWVPAFYPHPSWLYRDLDITFVMHPAAVIAAAKSEPGLRVAVGALPVRDAFAPRERAVARARLGLEPGRFTVALCPGSLGFGGMSRAAQVLLDAGGDVQVLMLCGRNERLRRELAGRDRRRGRLRVFGWTDNVPGLMAASDVVVGNAGGATGLEALASGRPVIMFEPIAGHGRANAELMADSGLALLAWSPAELSRTVRRLASNPRAAAELSDQALARATGRRREEDLADLAALAVR